MECPICGSKLVLGEEKHYETLADHVCDPNGEPPKRATFVCPNESCGLYGNSFWDWHGALYSGLKLEDLDKVFNSTREDRWHNRKNSCTSAMNSYDRQKWFEIYYKEESKRYFLGKYGFFVKNELKADKRGNIISRKPHIEWLQKDSDGNATYRRWGVLDDIHMFNFDIEQAYKAFKHCQKGDVTYYVDTLKANCICPEWDNRKWRKLSCKINSFLYKKYIK